MNMKQLLEDNADKGYEPPKQRTSPRPEDYPTLQDWSDAYWDNAKKEMHEYIDKTWDDTFKKVCKQDPLLRYFPLVVGLVAGVLAFIFSVAIQLVIHYCK